MGAIWLIIKKSSFSIPVPTQPTNQLAISILPITIQLGAKQDKNYTIHKLRRTWTEKRKARQWNFVIAWEGTGWDCFAYVGFQIPMRVLQQPLTHLSTYSCKGQNSKGPKKEK